MTSFLANSPFDWYGWVILPIIIFFARICDVTLGTIRIIFISRGLRKFAPFLGFFEVLIWIVVIGQLVQNLHSITAYIFYAAGFAVGNYVGMWIENRLAVGTSIIRIILSEGGNELADTIHNAGFGVTRVEAKGTTGPVILIYTIVQRKNVEKVLTLIHSFSPKAFVTIEEVRSAEKGFFPPELSHFGLFFFDRKSK